MRIHRKAILATLCALAGVATAKPAPTKPDFLSADASLPPVGVIPFDFDSSQLQTADRIELRQAARWLQTHPRHRLVIEAHTDGVGSEVYNMGLASRRARTVRDALIAGGVRPDRVVAVVYGEAAAPSPDPRSQANRVGIMYATTLAPQEIARQAQQRGFAIIW